MAAIQPDLKWLHVWLGRLQRYLVNGTEVAILQLFLHQAFGFGFKIDSHDRNQRPGESSAFFLTIQVVMQR
jgi:hypothetical protein